jgi:tRNA dimethylallyltransferase
VDKGMEDESSGQNSTDLPPAIMLMGPTASGKTQLAVELVRALPCEIVSVDSAMVYRGMDIGTAKPDASMLADAPHRLIDFLDPSQHYSAACFRKDALREMKDICFKGRIPLLVGGTMLYFRILKQGLTRLPSADPIIRARIDKELQTRGSEFLHQRLQRADPVAALRIHPNDTQRLQRALEVYELTGIPISEHHTRQRKLVMDYRLIKLALIPHDRGILHQTIASRFKQMLKKGLINEVEALYERKDLSPDLPAIRAVGYRQVWSYLQGNCEYADMVHRAIAATRQLAKRQLTWLRSEQEVKRLTMESNSIDQLVRKISAYV